MRDKTEEKFTQRQRLKRKDQKTRGLKAGIIQAIPRHRKAS